MQHQLVYPDANLVLDLATNMSAEASNEVWAATRQTEFEALTSSIMVSREAHAWTVNGKCMAIFGVGGNTAVSRRGMPWMLGSKELPRYGRLFARGSKIIVDDWLKEYTSLRNVVDARYTVSLRWLEWLGFTRGETIELGPDKMPFIVFEKKRPVWDKQSQQ